MAIHIKFDFQQTKEVAYNDYVDGDVHVIPINFTGANSENNLSYKEDGSGDHVNPQNFHIKSQNPVTQTNGNEKKTTFAASPNTTTWQQQKTNSINNMHEVPSIPGRGCCFPF